MSGIRKVAMGTLENAVDNKAKGWATTEIWTKHQAVIAKLYQEHELTEVMRIMERQYNFRATSVIVVYTALILQC